MVIKFEVPRVSHGANQLTKKPEDSGYEIAGDEVDWSCGTIYIAMVGCDWCISILTVPARSCSLSGPLLYHFPVVFLDRRHPRFGNFNSAVLVDVIRVKTFVDSFLDPHPLSFSLRYCLCSTNEIKMSICLYVYTYKYIQTLLMLPKWVFQFNIITITNLN